MKVCAGNGGIAPFTLNQDIGLRLVASFTPRPLYLLERVLGYPLKRRLDGSQR